MARSAILFATAVLLACSEDPVAPRITSHASPVSASAVTGPYSFIGLGDLGGGLSVPYGLNDRDQVVGFSSTAESPSHAFLWTPDSPGTTTGTMLDLGTGNGTVSHAYGINNVSPAYIVGDEMLPGASFAAYWQANLDAPGYTIHELPDLAPPAGGRGGQANAINDDGVIVGQDGVPEQNPVATLWQLGASTATALIPPQYQSAALSINNGGQVVGWFRQTSDYQAFLWQNGSYTQLPDLPAGDPAVGDGPSAQARAINDAGQIVGWSTDANHRYHGVVWEPSGTGYTITDLTTQFADPVTEGPFGINNGGVASGNIGGTLTVWQNTGSGWITTSLGTPADPGVGTVGGINSLAHIVGSGNNNQASSAFLAVPNPTRSNQPPAANAGGPYSGIAGEAVTLDGRASSDPDGDSLTYVWDFGDHSSGSGAAPSHTYTDPGTYAVALTVNDGQASSSAQATVTVTAREPFLHPCGAKVTGIAYDGTYYYIAEGHDGGAHCVGRYSASGALLEIKAFNLDTRGLHYVPATHKMVARTFSGPLWEVDYAAGTQAVLTNYEPLGPGGEQSQPAADPDGSTFWVLKNGRAERRRIADNTTLTAFAVVSTATNPTIAVTNKWVLVLNGSAADVYSKGGVRLGSQALPAPHGCDYYGFGAAAAGDRLMYDTPDCYHVAVVPITGDFNQAPVANAGGPYSGDEGASIGFDGSRSSDPDDDPVTYAWSFGDGTTASGATSSHVYGKAGSFTVTLTVTDSHGASNSSTAAVAVANLPPTVNAGTYGDVVATRPLTFNGGFTDAGNDSPWTYTIAWGDGQTTTGHPTAQGPITARHTYTDPHLYTIGLTVKDAAGASQSATAGANVVPNATPTAVITGPTAGTEGSLLQFDGSQSSDPNGDRLTYSWSWGDGGTSTGATPGHKFDDNGTYTVTLTVTDAGKLTGTATSVVTIADVPPTAKFVITKATISEGSAFNLALSAAKDVSTADKLAGFFYTFDCGTGPGPTTSDTSTDCPVQVDGDASVPVQGWIKDKDGGLTKYSGTVTVKNAAPQVALTTGDPTTLSVGTTFSVTGQFTDVGVHDAPWAYSIKWGDGSAATSGQGEPGTDIKASHTYKKKSGASPFPVKMTVTDKDNGTGSSQQILVTVQ